MEERTGKILYVNFNEAAASGMFRQRLAGLRKVFRARTKTSMTEWRALRR